MQISRSRSKRDENKKGCNPGCNDCSLGYVVAVVVEMDERYESSMTRVKNSPNFWIVDTVGIQFVPRPIQLPLHVGRLRRGGTR
jgi:hypothetical protein